MESDITALLSGKTYDELAALQRKVQDKLTSGEPVDTEYWENLLKKLLVWKAKVGHSDFIHPQWFLLYLLQAKLKSLHEVVVRNRLEQLRKRQRDEALHAQEELLAGVVKLASNRVPNNVVSSAQIDLEGATEEVEPYDREMSPEPLDTAKLNSDDRQIRVISVENDKRDLVRFVCYDQHYLLTRMLVPPTAYRCCISFCTQSCQTGCRRACRRSCKRRGSCFRSPIQG